jgi:hypothetical protein
VRLIDTVFRQGHLSERALVEAITSGTRPLHLDRCDICAERAVQLARWMDEIAADGTDLADRAFTPERLAAQQQQILRRLEQLDHPARVISFPAASRAERQGLQGRRVAVSWVGIAAAAGLLVGVAGGQITARLSTQPAAPPPAAVTVNVADTSAPAATEAAGPINREVFTESYETLDIPALGPLNDGTPRMLQASAKSGK